ncbi:MAG: hypothetical protein IPN84_13910 [Sphingomonadales bacterium]|jgi:hypothetical protein|nr:hypothetical protein [Sphingomonadales bacterium]
MFVAIFGSAPLHAGKDRVDSRPFQLRWQMRPNVLSGDEVLEQGSGLIKIADHYAENVVVPSGQTSITISSGGTKGKLEFVVSPAYRGFMPSFFGAFTIACFDEPFSETKTYGPYGVDSSKFQFICLLDEQNRGFFDKAFLTNFVKTSFPEFESDIQRFLPTEGTLSYAKADPKSFSYSTSYVAFEKYDAKEPKHAFATVMKIGGRERRSFGALGQTVNHEDLSKRGTLTFLDWLSNRNRGRQGTFLR